MKVCVRPWRLPDQRLWDEWLQQDHFHYINTRTNCVFGKLSYCRKYVACREGDEDPVGFIMLSELRPNYFYISSFIVKPTERMMGIGSQLWSEAISSVGDDANLGLMSVEPLTTMYRTKFGFNVSGIRVMRFQLPKQSLRQSIRTHLKKNPPPPSVDLQTATVDIFNRLIQYVQESQGRTTVNGDDLYFREFFGLGPVHTVSATDQDGNIVGFGSIAPGLEYHRFGPLFADNMAVLLMLIDKVIDEYDDQLKSSEVLFAVPEVHQFFIEYCTKVEGFESVMTFDMSYTKRIEYTEDQYSKLFCY